MPRFFDPERYNEDWYIELKGEYQKLFDYIIEMCDNAGVWKPNKFDFETKTGFKINLDSLIEKVNGGKDRILILENGRWFIPGFIQFQWFNKKSSFVFKDDHPFHKSLVKLLEGNKINQALVKGLERGQGTLMAKDSINVFKNRVQGKDLGVVVYDAEAEILKNQIEFERICTTVGKNQAGAKESLRKYHLYLEEKEQYPKGRKAVFAGFEKWLRNEKNFNHQSKASATTENIREAKRKIEGN